jgi:hypothetical protein
MILCHFCVGKKNMSFLISNLFIYLTKHSQVKISNGWKGTTCNENKRDLGLI